MAGVYISYPFCARKCTFCNFASGVFARDLEERYIDALCAELARFGWQWITETVYIGGGTPSRMTAGALARVLSLVPGRPWREATIEAAPGAITREQAGDWRAAGIDRVSLGVQSFVARELAGTGRTHTADGVASDVAALRAAGIANFNVDLIAGLPRQTARGWEESLDWIERLEAPHVSVYMLEVDEDSRLGAEMLRGGARYGAAEAPCEEQVAAFYERAVERLERAGIRQYEISNFARPGCESLHNLKYWRLEPYAGFGADAHSLLLKRERDGAALSSCLRAGADAGGRPEGSLQAGGPPRETESSRGRERARPPLAGPHAPADKLSAKAGSTPNLTPGRDREGAVGAPGCGALAAGHRPAAARSAAPHEGSVPRDRPAPQEPAIVTKAVRRQNPETVQDYLAGAPPIETPATPEERFFIGLRLREGVRLLEEDRARHAEAIARHTSLGLLEEHAGRLRLTRRGILLSNEVLQDFLP